MKIKKVIINNFRAFKHEEFEFGDFNCIIGKNDSGKSTILAALKWFFNDENFEKEDANVNIKNEEEDVSVEIHFSNVVFSDALFDKDFLDENKNVRITKIITNPRFMDSDIVKPIPYYSMQTKCFDNRNKIFSDSSLEELMEECIGLGIKTEFFEKKLTELRKHQEDNGLNWVPQHLNNLIPQIRNVLYNHYDSNNYIIKNSKKIFNEEKWFQWLYEINDFYVPSFVSYTPLTPIKKYLNDLFNYYYFFDDTKTQNIADEISRMVNDDTGINSSLFFDYLNCDFFPNTKKFPLVTAEDLKIIPVQNRGDGFQQIIKNAVFRIFAEKQYNKSGIFTFEEPETNLHPSAQIEMYETIKRLSENPHCQVFIITHSPYIVKELAKDEIAPIVIKREEDGFESRKSNLSEKVLPYTSMNEINYIAFDEPTIEYHIELYGYMQNKLNKNVKELDDWLKGKGCKALFDWYNTNDLKKMSNKMTLPYCVRNNIDHPLIDDNSDIKTHTAFMNNSKFDNKDLIRKSIDIMRNAISSNTQEFK